MSSPTPRQGVTLADVLRYVRSSKVKYKHDFNHGFNAGLEAVEVYITGFLACPPITRLLSDEEMEQVIAERDAARALDTVDDCTIPEGGEAMDAMDDAAMERLLKAIGKSPGNDAMDAVVLGFRLERQNLNNRK